MTELLLGGKLAPIGKCVAFLRRPMLEVRDAILTWRRQELRQTIEDTGAARFPDCMAVLDPLEAPWTVEVLIDCGEWTAYMNNWIQGGDPTAAAPYLAVRLGCDCIVALHAPPYGPGHASTQLCMIGPDGASPHMYVRTIAAHAEDGRWSWDTYGSLQPFEQPERYEARKIKDRFDRALLVTYLSALGIRVDDLAFYGEGCALRRSVEFVPRRETVAQVRARFG
ncbi:MAG TPA: hypothetical protein VFQ65_13205 [Kofleriaceae bacterium]|nr:hypothetical protein [Kofleriaceae bacterium]